MVKTDTGKAHPDFGAEDRLEQEESGCREALEHFFRLVFFFFFLKSYPMPDTALIFFHH